MGALTRKYENAFPRFLTAVTTMASSRGTLGARLADAALTVAVFSEQDIPPSIIRRYREFSSLLREPAVPTAYRHHYHPAKSSPAYYLSWQKQNRAAELLVSMFETIAYRRGWTEAELVENEDEEAE